MNRAGAAAEVLRQSRALRAALGRFRTRGEWLAHPEGATLATAASHLLAPVRRWEAEPTPAAPPAAVHTQRAHSTHPYTSGAAYAERDWMHVVHWNILHGDRYERVRAALRDEPALAGADLVTLNEVDLGLARSGNRDVAFDLARDLGLHAVWAALYLELEGGHETRPELAAAPQAESMLGLALLSRFPLGAAQRVELLTPADLLFDYERKVGSFIALVVEVLRPGAPLHVVVTHLDVHSSPDARQAQMRTALAALPPGPALLAGDLNTTTLARGSWVRSARALAVLAFSPPSTLRRRLLRPESPPGRPREPLFTALERAGFTWAPFNDAQPSLDPRLEDVHEFRRLPSPLRLPVRRLLRHVERRSHHRLDWIAARGFDPAPERPPCTLPHLMRGTDPPSDHAPIACGLRLRGAPRA